MTDREGRSSDATGDAEETDPKKIAFAYGLLCFVVVIWASAFPGIRYVVGEIDAMAFTGLRLTVATIGLAVMGLAVRIPIPDWRDVPRIALAGILGFTLYHVALNFGLEFVTAGQGSFVISTIPVWTAVLAALFLNEEIPARTWIGMAVALGGVALMSLRPDNLAVPLGSALVLVAALFAATNIVLQKGLLAKYDAFPMAVYVAAGGSAPMLFYLPFRADTLADLSTSGWLVTIYLGLIPIALGYWLNTVALKILPANKTSQMLLLIPPIASVMAWLWIGEEPGPRLWIGGALILLGVYVGRKRRRRKG